MRIKFWSLLAGAMLTAGVNAQPNGSSHGGFRWACQDTGRNSKQCRFENDGEYKAEVCTNVVKVCKDGDHVAMVCSGEMMPREVTQRVVHDFYPKVKLFEKCMGTEYRDSIISQNKTGR